MSSKAFDAGVARAAKWVCDRMPKVPPDNSGGQCCPVAWPIYDAEGTRYGWSAPGLTIEEALVSLTPVSKET